MFGIFDQIQFTLAPIEGHFFSDDSRSPKKKNKKAHLKHLNGLFWTFIGYTASILPSRSDFQA